ncbi:MAG: hypothetical protein BWK79_00615 [Beggiatoa sp. IS2]|nr:MAG: hypothetical protein BWK79_00615 [Beggiatoa sp. IS2]
MLVKRTLGEQRKVLTALLEPAMLNLSKHCAEVWSDSDALDKVLNAQFPAIPHCHLVYAVDKFGKQVSANVSLQGIDKNYRGQDLSRRPYSVSLYPKRYFMLSSVYISQIDGYPCISAVQPVIDDQQFLGFIVADFDIRHLPLSMTPPKSVPVSTGHVPQRVTSTLDQHIDEVMMVLSTLISEHAVFHCLIHYASSQIVLWQLHDPYQYRLYEVEQLLDPNMASAYPPCVYPSKATLMPEVVRQVLENFRTLRLTSNNFYLCSSSINIINGMVSLSFTYEDPQYLPAEIFLSKDLSAWLGQNAVNES